MVQLTLAVHLDVAAPKELLELPGIRGSLIHLGCRLVHHDLGLFLLEDSIARA